LPGCPGTGAGVEKNEFDALISFKTLGNLQEIYSFYA
jgi:hypothetical protein